MSSSTPSSEPNKRKLWSMESRVAVVKSVESSMGVRQAAMHYNVPFETLRRTVQGIVSVECRSGPPTALTVEEEEKLACYCVDMTDMGFGLSREDVMIKAFNIVNRFGRAHPFLHGQAGRRSRTEMV